MTGDAVPPLDGNAAAGLLRELFAFDMTTAMIACGGCGRALPIGAARAYGGSMGAILRCTDCETAILRLVRTPRGLWLDLRGARVMHVRFGAAPPL
jgi:hypothetical protein